MRASVWKPLADAFADDAVVHMPELPGHATIHQTASGSLTQVVDGIACGEPEGCTVVGWSLGGLIALAWAGAKPAQVRRLILMCATPCFVRRPGWDMAMPAGVFADFHGSLGGNTRATLQRFCALQAAGDASARRVLRELAGMVSPADADSLDWGLRVLRDTDIRDLLPHIEHPVLVIHGEHDRLVPLTAAEYLASQVPNGKLAVIPGASHAPFVSQPEKTFEAIREFIHG
jgi:pimeloyl-[acyl-carrier protein] methyl ester esterase